ncbi:chemotaxis response regulator protein-glutamate methylesterase [Neisseriaceae bacterium TC5R-5]|nr:chemotaxis response regulator protein-glutamate methylesterase [Neisseriaceae bacterium TC5R-5]
MSISVIIVDDSAVVREVLSQILSMAPDIKVLAACADPLLAINRMRLQWPDVVVLDIDMPRMDGLTFLRQIMAERPTPVVICAALNNQGANVSFEALTAGAVAVIGKPTGNTKTVLPQVAQALLQEVRDAAGARMGAVKRMMSTAYPPAKLTADAVLEAPTSRHVLVSGSDKIVAMGTSTGGTQALEFLLPKLSPNCPPVAVVQHMPAQFTASFAQRLDGLCQVKVREAKNGDQLMPGLVLIAPGGRHLLIKRSGKHYVAEVKEGPPVSRHCPSVDVLFRSVAVCAGRHGLGIIMTGMGDDGARGLREMRDAGARTVAQDEASSVVFGMPSEAINRGGVDDILSLEQIAQTLMGLRA